MAILEWLFWNGYFGALIAAAGDDVCASAMLNDCCPSTLMWRARSFFV
jgi:hypothetical protein